MVPIRSSVAVLCLLAIALPFTHGGTLKIETNGGNQKVIGDGFEVTCKKIDVIKAQQVNGGMSLVLLAGIPPRSFQQSGIWMGKNTRGEANAEVRIKITGNNAAWSFKYKDDKVELSFMPKPPLKK